MMEFKTTNSRRAAARVEELILRIFRRLSEQDERTANLANRLQALELERAASRGHPGDEVAIRQRHA